MSIFAAAFRSSHGVGAGTSVVLIRWSRRAASVGPVARARPCGHAFFMLRFLGRRSAGTDISFTGRAGRGLILSRRNKRRAEERRSDKSRDCKFGSHQNVSVGYKITPNHVHSIQFRRVANIAQISYSKTFWIVAQTSVTFQTSVVFRTQDLRKVVPLVRAPRRARYVEHELVGR